MSRRSAQRALVNVAESQRGIFTNQQAFRQGVTRLELSRLAADGLLERIGRGVYRLSGVPIDPFADLYSAWLLTDPYRTPDERALDTTRIIAVSHRSAAALWGIGELIATRHHFTATYRRQTERRDSRITVAPVAHSEVRVVHGMLTTSPERTIADLAATELDDSHVADALADAVRTRLVSRGSVAEAFNRRDPEHGGARVDAMLAQRGLDAASMTAGLNQILDAHRQGSSTGWDGLIERAYGSGSL